MVEQALQNILDPNVLVVILLSAVYGIFVGAVPGLTATMAVALLVPLTFHMKALPALAAVVTLEACAIFAGDIPAALVRIPGTPSSAAYTDDLYAYASKGQPGRALGVSLVFSVVGGLFGSLVLILFAEQVAKVATMFTFVEYFWFYLLGLGCAVVASRGAVSRGILALVIGLLFSTIGLSAVHPEARFTFGRPELLDGINFIPAMIGLFGASEVFRNLLSAEAVNAGGALEESPGFFASVFRGTWGLLLRRKLHVARSGAIGSVVGILPGAGADIAAWVSYGVSKRLSKNPDEYGKGSLEGVSDGTTANNAALAGAWVPALVFGIPGDSITALVIGILMMKNLKPGPEIFTKQGALVYSLYLVFILANLLLIPIGFLAIKAGGYIIRIPRKVLLPIILLFCVLGAYAINGSYFDVWIMLAFGLIGFALERWKIPLGPVVLGIVLGGPLEERFVQTMIRSEGSLLAFFSRPVAAVLGILCLLLWLSPLIGRLRRRAYPRSPAGLV